MQRSHAVILAAAAAIAGLQTILASTTTLSRWKGGGFGMYTDPHPFQSRVVWLVPRSDPGALQAAVRLYPPAPALAELLGRDGAPDAALDIAEEAQRFRSFPRDSGAARLLEHVDRLSMAPGAWRVRVTEVSISEDGANLRVQSIYDGPPHE